MPDWYALRVRSRCEKSVASAIHGKGYETFLPVQRCLRVSSGRSEVVDFPLFRGYVFCRLDIAKRLPILITPNVLHIVCSGTIPIAIRDSEIAAIQTALGAEVPVQPWPYLGRGHSVRLESGPMEGVEGFLLEAATGHRLIVSLHVLQQSVAMEIEHGWLRPLTNKVTG